MSDPKDKNAAVMERMGWTTQGMGESYAMIRKWVGEDSRRTCVFEFGAAVSVRISAGSGKPNMSMYGVSECEAVAHAARFVLERIEEEGGDVSEK